MPPPPVLVLDENFSEHEVSRLRERRVRLRVIGVDLAVKGADDMQVLLPLLHRLKQPTFFTRDRDFWRRELGHGRYCLVFVAAGERPGEAAGLILRFLGEARFRTRARRAGRVVHLHPEGITWWEPGDCQPRMAAWSS